MKIIEIKCEDCKAEFEALEGFPQEMVSCIACQGKNLTFTPTEREFEGCGGNCNSCDSCETETE